METVLHGNRVKWTRDVSVYIVHFRAKKKYCWVIRFATFVWKIIFTDFGIVNMTSLFTIFTLLLVI